MELRRVADAFLRSQPSPLAICLAPTSAARWATTRQLSCRSSYPRSLQRNLSATTRRCALKPSAVTTAAPPVSESSSADSQPNSQSEVKPKPAEESLGELAASLNWTARPIPAASRGYTPLSKERERRFNGGTSSADILRTLNSAKNSSKFDSSRMMDPAGPQRPQGMMRDVQVTTMATKAERMISLKLNPSTGRSVTINAGIDVGRGFRLLEQSCARNRVRSDANKQRFHERGGLKRKRLRRERWRKRFMEGFKATIGRVKQLKKQGW
jgi:small subunit ribosomal protein MRP21